MWVRFCLFVCFLPVSKLLGLAGRGIEQMVIPWKGIGINGRWAVPELGERKGGCQQREWGDPAVKAKKFVPVGSRPDSHTSSQMCSSTFLQKLCCLPYCPLHPPVSLTPTLRFLLCLLWPLKEGVKDPWGSQGVEPSLWSRQCCH